MNQNTREDSEIALIGLALDPSPPFLGRIQAREGSRRDWHVKEDAQRLPALGNIEHKQAFRRDRGTHLFGAAPVGRYRPCRSSSRQTSCLSFSMPLASVPEYAAVAVSVDQVLAK